MAQSAPVENGVAEWKGTMAELRAASALSGLETLVVDLTAVRSKRGLMRALHQGLRLPAHFGQNWDALADCLMDRDWLPPEGTVIALADCASLRRKAGTDWETLVEVMIEAADFWRDRSRPFRVYYC